jgi:hypothetical integral membrane protein (TIGR02206 family)
MFGDFGLFWFTHLVVLGLLFVVGLLIWFWLGRQSLTLQKYFKWLLVAGLILQLIAFNGWHLYFGTFDPAMFLPFHLCTISVYLIIYALVSRNNFANKLVLFWSPVSAFVAIALPDMSAQENFPSFRFIEFFGSHLLIIWACVYILRVVKPNIIFKDCWVSFACLIGTLPFVTVINHILKSNYMYLASRPAGGQMNFLPSEPWHVLGLIAIFAVVFGLEFWVYRTQVKKVN